MQSHAYQAPLFMGFPKQEHWSRLLFPSPRDLPNLGIEPEFLALQVDYLLLNQQGSPKRPYGWALIQSDWCPDNKGRLKHRHTQRKTM